MLKIGIDWHLWPALLNNLCTLERWPGTTQGVLGFRKHAFIFFTWTISWLDRHFCLYSTTKHTLPAWLCPVEIYGIEWQFPTCSILHGSNGCLTRLVSETCYYIWWECHIVETNLFVYCDSLVALDPLKQAPGTCKKMHMKVCAKLYNKKKSYEL